MRPTVGQRPSRSTFARPLTACASDGVIGPVCARDLGREKRHSQD
jgi:hypothetical protein